MQNHKHISNKIGSSLRGFLTLLNPVQPNYTSWFSYVVIAKLLMRIDKKGHISYWLHWVCSYRATKDSYQKKNLNFMIHTHFSNMHAKLSTTLQFLLLFINGRVTMQVFPRTNTASGSFLLSWAAELVYELSVEFPFPKVHYTNLQGSVLSKAH